MKNEKIYIEGYVVGFLSGTDGTREKKIQVISGEIVNIDENFIYKSIEPQKVVVPQFVANWYEEHKDILEYSLFDYVYKFDKKEKSDFKDWVNDFETEAFQTLVNMHQFGYEIEKEPKYTVRVKATLGQYLGRYYLNNEELTLQFTRTHFPVKEKLPTFTRKELEEANFGWVFDCPGVEVEEV